MSGGGGVAMQLFNFFRDFYKDVNPSTLTGAVDVIVIEDVATGRLTCSPFHVRFGKLQVLRPSEKKVELEVNGEPVQDVSMKIGIAGETFFVLPVEGPVPSEYQTSPLQEPIRASTADVPQISLALSQTALSDGELDGDRKGKREDAKTALSDSELETSLLARNNSEEDWTLKWGEKPVPAAVPGVSDLPVSSTKEVVLDEQSAVEAEILGLAPPLPQRPDVMTTQEAAPTVSLIEHVSQVDTVTLMYSRLTTLIEEEGIEGLDVCLLSASSSNINPEDLLSLQPLTESLQSIAWDDFSADPDASLNAALLCIHGKASAKCAVFTAKGAIQMWLGLKMYGKLISLERLLQLSAHKAHAEQPPQSQQQASSSILSWRQWWSSPRSQSAKAVPAPPFPSPTKTQPNASIPFTAVKPEEATPLATIPEATAAAPTVNYAKSLRLPSADLKKLNLRYGMNAITFSVSTGKAARANCAARIFLWRSDDKIVISDIDGTITKSDALGHLFQFVGKDWTHLGVANLYTDIARNGYRFLYLTSRPIGQATQTRGYLRGVAQDRYQLPEGPVIMSPDRFFMAMRREVIEGNPEQFKIPCLLDIRRLFYTSRDVPFDDPMTLSVEERALPCPFYAGFGNRSTDALSYQAVGINPSRIYIINPAGDLSLHVLSAYRSSYNKLVDLVDNVFPPLNAAIERDRQPSTQPAEVEPEQRPSSTEMEEFNEFFFWRQPMVKPSASDLHLFLDSPSLLIATELAGPDTPSGQAASNATMGESTDAAHDDSASERGDLYYFEEREEAGLIPFA